MECGASVAMREAHARHIERLSIRRERSLPLGDEDEFRFRIDEAANEPGARHPVDSDLLAGDPSHLFLLVRLLASGGGYDGVIEVIPVHVRFATPSLVIRWLLSSASVHGAPACRAES